MTCHICSNALAVVYLKTAAGFICSRCWRGEPAVKRDKPKPKGPQRPELRLVK